MSRRIIISASSDIGAALARHWLGQGHEVWGTYRSPSPAVEELKRAGANLVPCDLGQRASMREACARLAASAGGWEALVVAPGTLDPVGMFLDCDYDEWERSIAVNFTGQLRVVHELLPTRSRQGAPGPVVLLFAGGGTNNAAPRYSSYTVSKIALIKMCELLDAELPDTRFTILGPGWVRTKIHEATLAAQERAGSSYQRTLERLAGGDCVPMELVVACCDWLVQSPREIVGGRNFSLVHDAWGSPVLDAALRQDANLYKLRRHGNDFLART